MYNNNNNNNQRAFIPSLPLGTDHVLINAPGRFGSPVIYQRPAFISDPAFISEH